MPSGNYSSNFSAGSISINSLNSYSADGADGREVELPIGRAGTLSTRTDANTGIATVESGHGISLGSQVDVFWDGGVRYGMDTPVVGATTISLEGGEGDDLPDADTEIVVAPQQLIEISFGADRLKAIGIMMRILTGVSAMGHAAFYNTDNQEVSAFHMTSGVMVFQDENTNTFAGQTNTDVSYVLASNGSGDVAMTFQLALLVDSTPD